MDAKVWLIGQVWLVNKKRSFKFDCIAGFKPVYRTGSMYVIWIPVERLAWGGCDATPCRNDYNLSGLHCGSLVLLCSGTQLTQNGLVLEYVAYMSSLLQKQQMSRSLHSILL